LNLYSPDSTDYVLTRVAIINKFTTDINLNNNLDSLFVYSIATKDLILVTEDRAAEKTAAIREHIERLISQYDSTDYRNWNVVDVGTSHYLTNLVRVNRNLYIGNWSDIQRYVSPLNLMDQNDTGMALVLSETGVPMSAHPLSESQLAAVREKLPFLVESYQTVADSKAKLNYLMVGRKSVISNLYFIKLVPEEAMFKSLLSFQRVIYLVPVAAILILLLFLLFLKRLFLNPLTNLIGGMRKIGLGNLEVRLRLEDTNEFAFLAQTFNSMVEEIRDLKIHVYEEKLRVQHAEFRHLQVQINPHFYMNCLNLMYNMAVLEDYTSIKKMSLHMAHYFRFIIKTNGNSITLPEELQHIRNYLEIQSLRFEDRLSYRIESTEEADNCYIPPLIVQPFVENAIIHGFKKLKTTFLIEIIVHQDEQAPDMLEISVADNGVGFPEEFLQQLQSSSTYLQESGHAHIGIWNVLYRLDIHYGGRASVQFGNRPNGGAQVLVRLPLKMDPEKQE
ncbi:sensor histidine kinase, partial [Paenibacillus sp. TAF58]